jgi:hypothetical protein
MDKHYKYIEELYELIPDNFGKIDSRFINRGPYEKSPQIILYLDGTEKTHLEIDCHSDKFWFHHSTENFIMKLDIETALYGVYKALDDIRKKHNINIMFPCELRIREEKLKRIIK